MQHLGGLFLNSVGETSRTPVDRAESCPGVEKGLEKVFQSALQVNNRLVASLQQVNKLGLSKARDGLLPYELASLLL